MEKVLAIDISTISATEKSLKQLHHEMNAVLDSSYDGILIADGQGRILRVNKSMERLTGLTQSEYTGKLLQEIVSNGLFLRESVSLRALRERKPSTGLQKMYDGKELLVTASPVLDEGGIPFRVIANVRDITELNCLKDQLDQTQLLSTQYFSELSEFRLQKLRELRLITNNEKMSNLLETATRVAKTDATVVLLGESGVGKELLVQFIHEFSNREDKPFITVNCGAIPRELMESEMFGYEEGAFTGAMKGGKPGLFEMANQGTLFMDEIGELSLDLQVKLLRVLQEQEIMPVGGTKVKKINVRVIAATHCDLEEMVADGKFREDLFYRLSVVPLKIPPLRERKDDIPLLLNHYLNVFNKKYHQNKSFSREVMDLLIGYHWPGNVRELINFVERVVITIHHEIVSLFHLPPKMLSPEAENSRSGNNSEKKPLIDSRKYYSEGTGSKPGNLKDILDVVEKKVLLEVFQKAPSIRQAAKMLGLSHSAILYKLDKHGIRQIV